MTNEEAYIRERMGDRSSFKVPEGYFDRLAQQVMERLPEDDSADEARVVPLAAASPAGTARRRWLRPLLYAAAIAVVAVFTAFIFFDRQQDEQTSAGVVTAQVQSQPADMAPADYFDEAADYAMLDNQDIYSYLLAEM